MTYITTGSNLWGSMYTQASVRTREDKTLVLCHPPSVPCTSKLLMLTPALTCHARTHAWWCSSAIHFNSTASTETRKLYWAPVYGWHGTEQTGKHFVKSSEHGTGLIKNRQTEGTKEVEYWA